MYLKALLRGIKITLIFLGVLCLFSFPAPAFFKNNQVISNLIYIASEIPAVLVTMWFVSKHYDIRIKDHISFRNIKLFTILAWIILGASSLIVLDELTTVIWVDVFHTVNAVSNGTDSRSMISTVILCTGNVLIIPVAEELGFRVCCLESIKQKSNAVFAAIISSAFFGIVHLGGWRTILSDALSGIILAVAYLITQNLVYSVVTHMGMNLVIVIIGLFQLNNIPVICKRSGYTFFTVPVFVIGIVSFLLAVIYLTIRGYHLKREMKNSV